MKKLLFSTILLIFALAVNAVPARRVWKTVKQSDGTQVRLMLVGDENFHCYKTTDGLPVIEEQGSYFYAKVVNDCLVKTDQLAHDVDQRNAQEVELAANLCTQEQLADAARKAPRVTQPRAPKRVGEATGNFTGSKKGLIILVQFKDNPFAIDNPLETYQNIANQEGYRNSEGAIGSVHDYFLKQSNGVFDLTFDVVGPYTTPDVLSYYGQNSNNGDNPKRVRELIQNEEYHYDGAAAIQYFNNKHNNGSTQPATARDYDFYTDHLFGICRVFRCPVIHHLAARVATHFLCHVLRWGLHQYLRLRRGTGGRWLRCRQS